MQFTCNKCNKLLSSKQRLNYHLEKKVCEKTISKNCSFCKITFSSKQRLDTHFQICKDRKWDKKRNNKKYNLKEVICYDCGDLIDNCEENCREKYINVLIQRKKSIDNKWNNCLLYFDEIVPYENREYWEDICRRCGKIRDTDFHIFNCDAV